MPDFSIESEDAVYSWDSDDAINKTASVIFQDESNNSFSDTQGFLRKKQIGQSRNTAIMSMVVSQSDYEDIFIPGLTHDSNWTIKFDRLIPSTGTSTGTFSYEDLRTSRDDLADGNTSIEIFLREVI
jgi:hypothetical protein